MQGSGLSRLTAFNFPLAFLQMLHICFLNDNLISNPNFQDNHKNPFPKKWNLSQVIELNKDSLKVIDKDFIETTIDFNEGNNWLSQEDFKIGDIFFTENLSISKIF